MNCESIYPATTSMRLLVRALKHTPKRLFSVWMSSLTCSCGLLESSRVGAYLTISQSTKNFSRPSALVSSPVSLTGTSGIKTISTSSTWTSLSCVRPNLMGVYSGPISAQVKLALNAQWTSSLSASTLV